MLLTLHSLSSRLFWQVLRDPSRPWGKDNYWIINPHSEYIFADGAFRRRRRRALKKGTVEEQTSGYHHHREGDPSLSHHHHHHKYPHLLPHSAAAVMSRYSNPAAISRITHQDMKPASAFTIDNILKNSADEHLKHLRDFSRNMDILRNYQIDTGNTRSVIQFNPRSLPLEQLLSHIPYPPMWPPPPPTATAIPSTSPIPIAPMTQAAYMEALNRWFLTTARLGTSVPPPAPTTSTRQSACTDPQCSCAK